MRRGKEPGVSSDYGAGVGSGELGGGVLGLPGAV